MIIRRVVEADREVLHRIAVELLEPLYGSQLKAFREWFTGEGFKHAFVVEDGGVAAGLLSLKANPAKDYLKISTLAVLPEWHGRGCGRRLFEQAEAFARECRYERIVVTVSEKKPESLGFFRRRGFETVDQVIGKYQPGVTEYTLRKEVARCENGAERGR